MPTLGDALLVCPACRSPSLVDFESRPGVVIQLCEHCRGLWLDAGELRDVVGAIELEELTEARLPQATELCPVCTGVALRPRGLPNSKAAQLGTCPSCRGVWLDGGAVALLEREHARRRDSARTARAGVLVAPAVTAPRLDESRSSFELGLENVLGVPMALALAGLFCATSLGGFVARLGAMPFHELGHALASWLTARPAVPLPFFTFWWSEQSIFAGLIVLGALGWFGVHSWLERRTFGVVLAGALFGAALIGSFLLDAETSLMLQILGGALGEIVFGALLLIAFHFPLPDWLRWDFWRWPALLPAALCYVQALLLWLQACSDAQYLPWGSAVGDASDGDMNRLVDGFGWTPLGLAQFYLVATITAGCGIAIAYSLALRRVRLNSRRSTS